MDQLAATVGGGHASQPAIPTGAGNGAVHANILGTELVAPIEDLAALHPG